MEQVQVKITGMAITQRYGTLSTGTILRTDAAFAKHLVEDCHAAEYLAAPVLAVDAEKVVKSKPPPPPPPPPPRSVKGSVPKSPPPAESTEETQVDPLQPDSPQE